MFWFIVSKRVNNLNWKYAVIIFWLEYLYHFELLNRVLPSFFKWWYNFFICYSESRFTGWGISDIYPRDCSTSLLLLAIQGYRVSPVASIPFLEDSESLSDRRCIEITGKVNWRTKFLQTWTLKTEWRLFRVQTSVFMVHQSSLNVQPWTLKPEWWLLKVQVPIRRVHRWTLKVHASVFKVHRPSLNVRRSSLMVGGWTKKVHRPIRRVGRWTFRIGSFWHKCVKLSFRRFCYCFCGRFSSKTQR